MELYLEGGNIVASSGGICLLSNYSIRNNNDSSDGGILCWHSSDSEKKDKIRKALEDILGCTQVVFLDTPQDCATGIKVILPF